MASFRKATREQAKLRAAFIGPAGSGKTYTSLAIACAIAELIRKAGGAGRVAVIDTECGSASLYAGTFDFDVLELDKHSPLDYVAAIDEAEREGYDVAVIDSLSHAWIGRDGALDQVDKAADRDPRGNSFTAWRTVTPKHNKLVERMLSTRLHLLATIRAKTEFVQEKNEKTGKTEIRKLGLAPIQRDGLEYEFGLVGDIDLSNTLKVSKTRFDGAIAPGDIFERPGKALAAKLYGWLMAGAVPVAKAAPVVPATKPAPTETQSHETDMVVDPRPDDGQPVAVAVSSPPSNDTVADAVDGAFKKYLHAMMLSTSIKDLDAAATGAGRPPKGTPAYDTAIETYKSCKETILRRASSTQPAEAAS